jgi:anti-anti-sigma factor
LDCLVEVGMTVNLVTACSVRHMDGSQRLVLAGEIDGSNRQDVATLLDEAFLAGGDVDLDLSGVAHMDATTVTVLLTARARFEAYGRSLRVVAASRVVHDLLDTAGSTHLMA